MVMTVFSDTARIAQDGDGSGSIVTKLASTAAASSSPNMDNVERNPSLPEEINIATRKLHTQLNRLITQRLPLALPPCTASTAAYASGIGVFAQVFQTFEASWRGIIEERHSNSIASVAVLGEHPPVQQEDDAGTRETMSPDEQLSSSRQEPGSSPDDDHDERIRAILRRIYISALMRTEAFETDLVHLSRLRERPDGTFTGQSQTLPQIQAFLSHIQASISDRPHVMLAYAWVFYMALFSGGRWIRAQLQAAGDDFWAPSSSSSIPLASPPPPSSSSSSSLSPTAASPRPGYTFLCFPGDEDGEDIKRAFRARLAEVELVLTRRERHDIVEESLQIFRSCILLVEELDAIHQTPDPPPARTFHRPRHMPAASSPGSGEDEKAALVRFGRMAPSWPSSSTDKDGRAWFLGRVVAPDTAVRAPSLSSLLLLSSSLLICLLLSSFLVFGSVVIRPLLPFAL